MEDILRQVRSTKLLPDAILNASYGIHTTIYLPYEGRDAHKLRGTFRCLLSEARKHLKGVLSGPELTAYFHPLRYFRMDLPANKELKGVGLFRSPNSFQVVNLQVSPPELVVVADSFHIKPLVHNIVSKPPCFVIVLNSNGVDFYRFSGANIKHLKSYNFELKGLQRGQSKGVKSNQTPEFMFLTKVIETIHEEFSLMEQQVAVFGPKHGCSFIEFELTDRYETDVFLTSLMPGSIEEMCNLIDSTLTHETKSESQQMAMRFMNRNQPGRITHNLQEIAEAAVAGRVAKLLIDPHVHVWGEFCRASGIVKVHDKQFSHVDDCVIDDITEEVIKRHGELRFFDSKSIGDALPYLAELRA